MGGEQKPSRWMLAIEVFKLLFLVGVSPILVWLAVRELATALSEQSPTRFQADRFVSDYRGQRWLHVEGRLLAELVDVQEGDNDLVKVHVPLVPFDWKPDQAVHLVGSFSMPRSNVESWKLNVSSAPQFAVTGFVGGPMNYREMFPNLRFETPVVRINQGGSPAHPIFIFLFLAFAVIMLVATWTFAVKLALAWRRRRKAEEEAAEKALWG